MRKQLKGQYQTSQVSGGLRLVLWLVYSTQSHLLSLPARIHSPRGDINNTFVGTRKLGQSIFKHSRTLNNQPLAQNLHIRTRFSCLWMYNLTSELDLIFHIRLDVHFCSLQLFNTLNDRIHFNRQHMHEWGVECVWKLMNRTTRQGSWTSKKSCYRFFQQVEVWQVNAAVPHNFKKWTPSD